MNRIHFLFFIAGISILVACTKPNKTIKLSSLSSQISKKEMQSVTEFLGNDLLEGRAPGTRGGKLTEIYLKSLCKILALEPGQNNTYLQPFDMKGFTSSNIQARTDKGKLHFPDDIVGTFTVEETSVSLKAELVFMGFGIQSDLMHWDDYKETDVKGKILICRVNDPGLYNPEIFEGDTLTYFGRWIYKIEEAVRHGAKGILLLHTDETAGYDWNVVKNSWSGEDLFIQSDLQNNLIFRGWVKESSLSRLLESYGLNLSDMYKSSLSKEFKPIATGVEIEISGNNTFRNVSNNNVIAHIPGQSKERIVLSAHIDHLGMDSSIEGDGIYNGAIDNGTAVAAMMITAKILKAYQENLYYSITILACNAEESGLLGSKYFVQNTNRSNIIANINFESTPVWDQSKSIMGIGARFSDLEEIIIDLAQQNGIDYSRFSLANQGLFYRSDQFSFARYNIPAVWISAGEEEVTGQTNYTQFWSTDYHTVRDEYSEDWKLDGMKQTIDYALMLIEYLNSNQKQPKWKNNLTFPVLK